MHHFKGMPSMSCAGSHFLGRECAGKGEAWNEYGGWGEKGKGET